MKKILFLTVITVIVLVSVSAVLAAPGASDRLPGQILVKFKEGTPAHTIEAVISSGRGKIADRIEALGVLVVNVPAAQEEKVVAALSRNPHVEYAEQDYLAFAVLTPNDPSFAPNQWGLENTGQNIGGQPGLVDADIDASTAWDTTLGGVRIAILDSGIDQNHEDLSAKIVAQRNFTTSGTIDDLYGHGTHVGGIAAAITNNSIGVAGAIRPFDKIVIDCKA